MTETTAPPAGATMTAVPAQGTGPIVVAVGGVDPDSVLRAARILERHATGGMTAVAVLEPPPASLVGSEPMLIPPEYMDTQREERRVELADRLRRFGGSALTWRTALLDGEPAFAIDDYARQVHAPLIVMGLGRHGALDRVFGTETTLRAIRLAGCAVLAVHPDLDAPFRDVVVATDFSAASAYAAQQAVALLDPGAVVHVVHVWQPTSTSDQRTVEADDAYRRSLDERFARFTRLLAIPSGVELRTVVREGKAAERVLDYAAAHRADLVVAGRHGLNAFERIVVGSQTTALLRAAARSILVAPEPPQPLRDRLRLALTGATRSTDPDEWAVQLSDFTARNRGRRAVLDVEDLLFAAKVMETGFVFLEAAYDGATKRVDLTLGDPDHDARRVTRTVGVVDSIEVTAAPDGRDVCLRIAHGGGETSLTFTDG
jgi:nucleotide-binding universal stress UspA family protein